jgi:aldehyde dehydrogenase (NAD+)
VEAPEIVNAGEIVEGLRAAFDSGLTRSLDWRLTQLRGLRTMLRTEEARFAAALHADLGKSATEAYITETGFLIGELNDAVRHLRGWLRPRRGRVPLITMPSTAKTVLEPLGVALVIAPWNYPLMLAVSPVIGALAAGNTVLLKPSELAPATSALLAELIPQFVDSRAIAVVQGGVTETTEILAQRFDTIFYTGNARVGQIVMEAAAKHLTPVTLELGGKSPAFVDESVDMKTTAERIVWGKFMNAGQTCVAPDYVITTPSVARKLTPHLYEAVRVLYGDAPRGNPDYGRIVNEQNFDRLVSYLPDGRAAVGGNHTRAALYIAPTVLTGVHQDAPIMQQEIFGPILPIIEVGDLREAIDYVNRGGKPLALYVFSNEAATRASWTNATSSGAIGFNVPVAHLSVPSIPFGGVGASGMGSYHGVRSVEAFSHEKAIFSKPLWPNTLSLLRPPYTPERIKTIRRLLG